MLGHLVCVCSVIFYRTCPCCRDNFHFKCHSSNFLAAVIVNFVWLFPLAYLCASHLTGCRYFLLLFYFQWCTAYCSVSQLVFKCETGKCHWQTYNIYNLCGGKRLTISKAATIKDKQCAACRSWLWNCTQT